jgi:uncharacterized membrane protein
MTPHWERAAGPPTEDGAPLFMDAVLTPHRSLSLNAFRLMLVVVICVNVAVAGAFVAHGAFPVAGFLGLDVLALWIAFRVNYRAAQIEERVQVGREHVHLSRRGPKGGASHWMVSTMWARAEDDGRGVLIRSGGGAQRVAAFLSPSERADFARALDAALWRAKKGM